MLKVFILLLISALALAAVKDKSLENAKKSFFVKNPTSFDYKLIGKNEEHRFGVELKDTKQHHHTTTAEDGVRLGCYGHEQDGKYFSTHYVADSKGYRIVPHDKVIMVYPKNDGEARKASFVSAFDENEVNKANIRYFFPEGCKSPEEREIPKIEKKTEDAVELPTTTQAPSTTIATTTTTESEIVNNKTDPEIPKDSCPTSSCCVNESETQMKILLPSSLECCSNTISKLVIPIETEKLAKIPISDINSLNQEDDLILMLFKLVSLIQKCRES